MSNDPTFGHHPHCVCDPCLDAQAEREGYLTPAGWLGKPDWPRPARENNPETAGRE